MQDVPKPKNTPGKCITGIIEITRKGTGYVPWQEDKEDIEIKNEDLTGALDGDTVEIKLAGLFPRPTGKVVRVLERVKEEFVATLSRADGALVGVPDDKKFYRAIHFTKEPQYAEGEKVLVRLLHFDGTASPMGEVVEHLGSAGEHAVEMHAIVLEHGFRTEFPQEVEREAHELAQTHKKILEGELKVRKDFRETPTCTIDPLDAKDFDDALSIVSLANGTYEVGIHIADVTHFVRPESALEEEARKRGTSVYLVDRTIPMLPEEISSGIASLKPNEDRLAFSVIFTMDEHGGVLEQKFEKTVIRSHKRFTYEEAQKVLESGRGPFVEELGLLRQLARKLKQKREKEGAIDFGENEVRFELDEKGVPVRVVRKERLETMSLIEEFMLLANREVAKEVSELAKKVPEKNLAFLYRIHDAPKEDRIQELATFVRAIGYEFAKKPRRKVGVPTEASGKNNVKGGDIAKLLKQIEGKPEEHLIRTATLRAMAKAIYSTKNIGHFGLSFEHYTHFTSPIRRYPDILVHRILASHVNKKPLSKKEFGDLEKLALAASEAEAKAVAAERESIRYKQVEYMQHKVGEEFDAVISGVTDWGLYVEEKETAADGLVRVRTLGDDFYNYSQKEYALVGQRTKKKFALGDRVRVRLVGADLGARQLDFELVR